MGLETGYQLPEDHLLFSGWLESGCWSKPAFKIMKLITQRCMACTKNYFDITSLLFLVLVSFLLSVPVVQMTGLIVLLLFPESCLSVCPFVPFHLCLVSSLILAIVFSSLTCVGFYFICLIYQISCLPTC